MDVPKSTPQESVTLCSADPHGAPATALLAAMCAELTSRYGRPPSPYLAGEATQPRTVFLVAHLDGEPTGCGALRRIDETTVEVKRMYVAPAGRRRGLARRLLVELERYAAGFRYERIILETGFFQPEALALYDSAGYRRTPPYGRYVGNPESVCFEKWLVEPTMQT